MFGVRILSAATAYSVVLLEVYSGVIKGPTWWVWPGALVLSLLTAVSLVDSGDVKKSQGILATTAQWVMMLGTAAATSWFANYFGREIVPSLIDK